VDYQWKEGNLKGHLANHLQKTTNELDSHSLEELKALEKVFSETLERVKTQISKSTSEK
jgi:hypothetical protein